MEENNGGSCMTVAEIQATVDRWIRDVGGGYFSPLTNMAVLTEEVGEVARLMARTYGDQTFKASDRAHSLADELADVVWVVAAIANQTGVDLSAAFMNNLAKKNLRDKERFKRNNN